MRTFAIAALLLASAGAAHAQGRPPQAVMAEVADMDDTCRNAGGRPGDRAGLIQTADLNNDRRPDWVINQLAYQCDGAASLFAGSGGGMVMVYAGLDGGRVGDPLYQPAFDFAIEGGVAQVTVGGEYCGQDTIGLSQAQMTTCRLPLGWDARQRQFVLQPASAAVAVDAALFLGTWTEANEACGGPSTRTYRRNGTYAGAGWGGDWEMDGSVMILTHEDSYERLRVQPMGQNRVRLEDEETGEVIEMKRCS